MIHPFGVATPGLAAHHHDEQPVIVPLNLWELRTLAEIRSRLDLAGRFDCVQRIDRMSNAELRAMAAAEGLAFRPMPADVFHLGLEKEALEVHKVDAAPSEQLQHQEVAEMEHADSEAHPWAMAS